MTEHQLSGPAASTVTSDPIGFEDLLGQALANYTSQTGHVLQNHMTQFIDCHSVENVICILETRTKDLKAFRKKGKKIRTFLAPVVRLIELVNDTGGEAAAATVHHSSQNGVLILTLQQGVPGGKAIFAAIAILLTVSNSISDEYPMYNSYSGSCRQPRVSLRLMTRLKISLNVYKMRSRALTFISRRKVPHPALH